MGLFSGIGSAGILSDKDHKAAIAKGERAARAAAKNPRLAAKLDRKAAKLDAKAAKNGWW